MVRTAHTLQAAAAALPPHARARWWQRARDAAPTTSGPGTTDRLLVRSAIEWASISDGADSDRLFEHRPSAWIVVELGGDDALQRSLISAADAQGIASLQWSLDARPDDPFDGWAERCALTIEHAPDAEAEALATAWRTAGLLRDGVQPIALIAQDRELVRRVRALLERMAIDVADETGWSLATTRAGARVAAALRAARGQASADDRLDWLKADLDDHQLADVAVLEALWRGKRVTDAVQRTRAEPLWQRELARLETFASSRPQPLAAWLRALDALLFAPASAERWRSDPAAVQLRSALRIDAAVAVHDAVWRAASAVPQDLEAFSAWVDSALESHTFVPPASADAAVVITPLSRAIGREFAAAVLPGADARRLGPAPEERGLLDDALRRVLDLPDRRARQRRAQLAFLHLLRLPRVVALYRRADADELLSPSPWLERVRLARQRRRAAVPSETAAALPLRGVARTPVRRPAPQAPGNLPPSLSASAVETLRQCPYRFFSRTVLRLSEHEELDDDADKREAGRWLHATLERFHRERAAPRARDADIGTLIAVAQAAIADEAGAGGTSAEAMLPYSAGLRGWATRYVRWLHEQEAQGWTFRAAEVEAKTSPTGAARAGLHGRIDRIDHRASDASTRLIDYKVSTPESLRRKVAQPLEDTQLAVYAATQLATLGEDARIEGCYVALDDAKGVSTVPHPGVAHSAHVLSEHIAAERVRIEEGAPLPALGEGTVCDLCEARGLCRRDHWSAGDEVNDGAR
jgi:ATP-dependent helicase/nuclease subunit B